MRARRQGSIGTAHEALGDTQSAQASYNAAAATEFETPRDAWYYQGLALERLGRPAESRRMYEGLIAAGQEQLTRPPSVDFFGKFLGSVPPAVQRAHSHYLVGLGFLGKGLVADAQAEFEAALRLIFITMSLGTGVARKSRTLCRASIASRTSMSVTLLLYRLLIWRSRAT